jgi:hypothetical protein
MYLIPEVAQYLLFTCRDRMRAPYRNLHSPEMDAEDTAAFEKHLAGLRPRRFLRTVHSDPPNLYCRDAPAVRIYRACCAFWRTDP